MGAGGAGGVKLCAVVGSFVGIRNVLVVFVLVALIGGVAAIAVSLLAGALGRVAGDTVSILQSLAGGRWAELRERSDMNRPGAIRLAYGAVIAAGALLFLWVPR